MFIYLKWFFLGEFIGLVASCVAFEILVLLEDFPSLARRIDERAYILKVFWRAREKLLFPAKRSLLLRSL